jgi:nitric oxide reductase NorE protein
VATEVTTEKKPKNAKHLPGEEGTWIFIMGDMTVFALLFGVFVYSRADDPQLFNESQKLLNQDYGAINTLLLLTSSLFVVTGIKAIRDHLKIAPHCFLGAMICGGGFVLVKFLEWGEKLNHGHNPGENDFFMYYYVLTGLHFFHLLIGMGVLTFLYFQAKKPETMTDKRFAFVEGGACFWHMVDLLWIVLFPLIYLMH